MSSIRIITYLLASLCFPGLAVARERWTPSQAPLWLAKTGRLIGVNYRPSTIDNPNDIWAAKSFDLEVIEQDMSRLEAKGHTSLQVFMHLHAWKDDPSGYISRVAVFLDKAKIHNLKITFNLLDYSWNPEPETFPLVYGKNRPAIPNWFEPPPDQLSSIQDTVTAFVSEIVGKFSSDERVALWNVWSEPSYLKNRVSAEAISLRKTLLAEVMKKVRSLDPIQPVVASFFLVSGPLNTSEPSQMAKFMMNESDIASYHWDRMAPSDPLVIARLKTKGIPFICTGMPYPSASDGMWGVQYARVSGGNSPVFYRWDFTVNPHESLPKNAITPEK